MSTIINGNNSQFFKGVPDNPASFSEEGRESNIKYLQEYNRDLQNEFAERISSNIGINDTLFQNSAAALSISALSEEELERARAACDNHPVSALYRNDIAIRKNAEDGYRIGQVEFTEEEFLSARNLMTEVGSQLKTGYLSYRDYAKMEMAEKVVEYCAAGSFSKEQAEVIGRAMRDYNDKLIRRQNDLLANRDYIENEDTESGKYFGVQVSISKEAKDLFNMNPNLNYSSTDIATNKHLIDTIRDSIRVIDISDKSDVSKIKSAYQSIMEPVYRSRHPFQSVRDREAVEDALSRDVDDLLKMIDFAGKWNLCFPGR